MTPKVSVIMPVFNSQNYVGEAISSVLAQTFTNFEFLIIDDCSTDDSVSVIKKYLDKRIRFYQNDRNLGYINSLNFLLGKCKGEYIVRHDNDDISPPDRILKQITFLQNNPEHLVCGCFCKTFGNLETSTFLPISDEECRILMLFNSPFCHPSVCFHRKIFSDLHIKYDPDFMPAEDYKMWVSISKFGKLANLSFAKFYLRIHDNNTSARNIQKQQQALLKIRKEYILEIFNIDLSLYENNLLNGIIYNYRFSNLEIFEIETLFSKIKLVNLKSGVLNKSDLDFWLFYFWTKVCFKNIYFKNLFYRFVRWFNSPLFSFLIFLKFAKRFFLHKFKYS
jgi:glycosyltransferase involved in cell wall biosynthesis